MTDGMKPEGKAIEKGEYVIGVAIILAALLVSGTIFMGMNSVADAIGKIRLNVTAAPGSAAAAANGTGAPAAAPAPSVGVVSVDYSGAQFKGKEDASLVMVEYSDFECPYCSRVIPTLEQIRSAYPNMKFIFRQFPLSFHPNAQKAAEAALCAAKQGKFWEMHDKLYANQQALTVADAKKYASDIGLDAAKFGACLDSAETAAQVAAEEQEGAGIGIRGTPGFLVYVKGAKGDALVSKLQAIASRLQALGVDASVVEVSGAGTGMVFAGALPYANFKEVVDSFGG